MILDIYNSLDRSGNAPSASDKTTNVTGMTCDCLPNCSEEYYEYFTIKADQHSNTEGKLL